MCSGLSRRLILAVFELVFVFSLGGPTPSEAADGRPLTERSKHDGPAGARGPPEAPCAPRSSARKRGPGALVLPNTTDFPIKLG